MQIKIQVRILNVSCRHKFDSVNRKMLSFKIPITYSRCINCLLCNNNWTVTWHYDFVDALTKNIGKFLFKWWWRACEEPNFQVFDDNNNKRNDEEKKKKEEYALKQNRPLQNWFIIWKLMENRLNCFIYRSDFSAVVSRKNRSTQTQCKMYLILFDMYGVWCTVVVDKMS